MRSGSKSERRGKQGKNPVYGPFEKRRVGRVASGVCEEGSYYLNSSSQAGEGATFTGQRTHH